jgi:acyl carrier protein
MLSKCDPWHNPRSIGPRAAPEQHKRKLCPDHHPIDSAVDPARGSAAKSGKVGDSMADDPIDVKALSDEQLGDSIEATVREFLRNEAGAENALTLGNDDVIWAHFDSLMVMELVVHLEDKFGVQINTSKTTPDELKTIGRIRDVATKAIRAASK